MPSLDTIAAYIRARLPEPPTPGEIAAHFGISRFALSRMFRAETGLSLREYIAALKIEQGIPALVAGESIIDSQLESGHASAATFSHRFRKHTGLAPRDYRREALALGSTIEEEMGNPRSRAISYRRFSNEQYRLPHPLDVHIEGRSARGVVFLGLYAEPIPRGAPLQGIALFHGNHARIDA
ncbi:MAG: helix-turn-helix transcriptional regulator, partial [Brachymonas sp.]|nr:helix-turn-helix transcriptional regulator [Brachymonas sp.]